MKKASYRIIEFPKLNKFIGVAWNYEEAVLISTRDYDSYTDARAALEKECNIRSVQLKYFDGHYKEQDGMLFL